MNIRDIITLEDNKTYLVLDTVELNKEKYLYCVEINEDESSVDEYAYFKVTNINGDRYIDVVEDEKVLKTIISLFTNNYLNDSIDTNEEQDV
jgi:hypothetical protein